jgi:hypothetical protein
LTWKELPVKIQERLEESLLLNAGKMNEDELSYFMKGSVRMGYEWNTREREREIIFERFKDLFGGKHDQTSSGRSLSTILFSLGEMKVEWGNVVFGCSGYLLQRDWLVCCLF